VEGKFFRPEMQPAMKQAVDYALSRQDVDPERLAAFGYSGGGGFVPQAAQHDPRIKAIAMSSAVVDAYPLFAAMPAVTATPEKRNEWSSFHRDVVKSICWRWGLPMDDPSALAEANKGYTFDPAAVTAPALIIVGEGEMRSQEVQRQQQLAMQSFANHNKKMVVTPSDEGAANHCIMENRSIVAQVLFDWLDETFK
jgi:acetyl esterase/lipase